MFVFMNTNFFQVRDAVAYLRTGGGLATPHTQARKNTTLESRRESGVWNVS